MLSYVNYASSTQEILEIVIICDFHTKCHNLNAFSIEWDTLCINNKVNILKIQWNSYHRYQTNPVKKYKERES